MRLTSVPLVRHVVMGACHDLNLGPHPDQWPWAGGPPRRMKRQRGRGLGVHCSAEGQAPRRPYQ